MKESSKYPINAKSSSTLRAGAAKYEAGTQNLLGIVGLVAAMEFLLELGVENIARELLRKCAWLVPALQSKGCAVLHAEAPAENSSGITSFFQPDRNMAELHQRLLSQNVVTSLRRDRAGQRYLRLSPHFYNTDHELQRVIEML